MYPMARRLSTDDLVELPVAEDGSLQAAPIPAAGASAEKASLEGNPTAQERADFVTRRLEQFIRDNRTAERGVNFRQWQAMARAEIINAIEDAELDAQKAARAVPDCHWWQRRAPPVPGP